MPLPSPAVATNGIVPEEIINLRSDDTVIANSAEREDTRPPDLSTFPSMSNKPFLDEATSSSAPAASDRASVPSDVPRLAHRPVAPSGSIPRFTARRSNDPPIWIDVCLAFLISVFALLIYKRMA